MTGGNIASRLPALKETPQWHGLHFSRIRRTDDGSLDTTGHTVSMSAAQIREALSHHDTSSLLLMDDTSFSGTTNALAERMLKEAFLENEGAITHGFLIANEGSLGPGIQGAIGRLGLVLAGHRMSTPRDDGWHIFDIVQHPDLERHLENLQRALHCPEHEGELFANSVSSSDLRRLQSEEKFVANQEEINGEWHIKNPQPLPRIVAAGHVKPIKNWHDENEVFDTLLRMGKIINGEE